MNERGGCDLGGSSAHVTRHHPHKLRLTSALPVLVGAETTPEAAGNRPRPVQTLPMPVSVLRCRPASLPASVFADKGDTPVTLCASWLSLQQSPQPPCTHTRRYMLLLNTTAHVNGASSSGSQVVLWVRTWPSSMGADPSLPLRRVRFSSPALLQQPAAYKATCQPVFPCWAVACLLLCVPSSASLPSRGDPHPKLGFRSPGGATLDKLACWLATLPAWLVRIRGLSLSTR